MTERRQGQTLAFAWLALGLLPCVFVVFGIYDLLRDGLAHAPRTLLTSAAICSAFLILLALFSLSRGVRGALGSPTARRVWFALLPLIFTMSLIEGAAGVYQRVKFPRPTAYSDDRLRSPLYQGYDWAPELLRAVEQVHYDYAPFRLWQTRALETPYMNVAADGTRRTYQPPAPEGAPEFRVQIYGGSTVFCLEVADNETLPSHIARELARRMPDRKIVVENLGVPSYVREQQEVWLGRKLLDGPKPDLVIFFDGGNDMLFCGWMELRHRRIEEFKKAMEGEDDSLRKIFGTLFFRYTNTGRLAEILTLMQRPPEAKPSPAELEARAKKAAANYAATADAVRLQSAAHGFKTAFFLQPTLYGKDHPTANEKVFVDYDYSIRPGLDNLYETFCAEVVRLESPKPSADFFDLSRLFDQNFDDVYFDPFHVGPRQNAALARAIVDALAHLLADSKPLSPVSSLAPEPLQAGSGVV
jgi:hypothetical protein